MPRAYRGAMANVGRTVAGSLLVAFIAGCVAYEEPVDADASGVVGGRVESGFEAVGYLTKSGDGKAACGATLIAPNLAVTAAHCIHLPGATSFGVGFGEVGAGPIYPARTVYVHPSYDPSRRERYIHDIALLELALRPEVAAAPVTSAAVGDRLRYVGYGRTTAGVHGADRPNLAQRRSAEVVVVGADRYRIKTRGRDGGLCWGDSGGPILKDGAVVGVLADFDRVYRCFVGNQMLFTPLAANLELISAAEACASGRACNLVAHALPAPEPDR